MWLNTITAQQKEAQQAAAKQKRKEAASQKGAEQGPAKRTCRSASGKEAELNADLELFGLPPVG